MVVSVVSVDVFEKFELYESLLPYVSRERQDKIHKYKFDKDKIVSLFAEILIRYRISHELNISYDKILFSYNEYGKPSLKECDNYHFSISHSKGYIVFVSDSHSIGIDIERIYNARLSVAQRFFTLNENLLIENSNDTSTSFFDIWTKKESYIKMFGVGLSKPLNSFDVTSDELSKLFYTHHINGYSFSICSPYLNDVVIERISSNRLIQSI